MADRKVLVKYFPKNFDPKLLVKRGRGKDKLMNVRNMLPMSLRCNVCANYLYIGTKFNMRMQICNEQTYLGIKVFRFYLKCTYCYNEICFKTDPKNHDYIVQDGGTRNYEPIKDAQQAQKLMKKMRKQQKQGNSMKFLQTKTYDSKREMQLMEALDDIKNLNKRHALIDPQDLLNNMFVQQEEDQKFTSDQQRQIDAKFDELRKKKLDQLKKQQRLHPLMQTIQQQKLLNNQEVQEKAKLQTENDGNRLQNKFNSQQYAIMKGNLYKLSEKQQKINLSKIIKSKVPKVKSIKKAFIPQKQNQKKKSQQEKQKQLEEQLQIQLQSKHE